MLYIRDLIAMEPLKKSAPPVVLVGKLLCKTTQETDGKVWEGKVFVDICACLCKLTDREA